MFTVGSPGSIKTIKSLNLCTMEQHSGSLLRHKTVYFTHPTQLMSTWWSEIIDTSPRSSADYSPHWLVHLTYRSYGLSIKLYIGFQYLKIKRIHTRCGLFISFIKFRISGDTGFPCSQWGLSISCSTPLRCGPHNSQPLQSFLFLLAPKPKLSHL